MPVFLSSPQTPPNASTARLNRIRSSIRPLSTALLATHRVWVAREPAPTAKRVRTLNKGCSSHLQTSTSASTAALRSATSEHRTELALLAPRTAEPAWI